MSDLNMTVYDMNKQVISQNGCVYKGKALKNKLHEFLNPFIKNNPNVTSYMLLCHELRDYTVFNTNDLTDYEDNFVSGLFDCINARGVLVDINEAQDNAIELWLRIDGEVSCYYLFDYSFGVINL